MAIRMISRRPNIDPLNVFLHAFDCTARVRVDAANSSRAVEDAMMSDLLMETLNTKRLRVPAVAAIFEVACAELS